MLKIFKQKTFYSLGVNPDADWSLLDSIVTPLELHEYIKSKVYTEKEIEKIQKIMYDQGDNYTDFKNQFNIIPKSKAKDYQATLNFSIIQMVSGVREEFKESQHHKELYEKYIAPSIIESLKSDANFLRYNIDNVKADYLEKGVVVPKHFDSFRILVSEYKNLKTKKTFRSIEIKERQPSVSLETTYDKVDTLIDKIKSKIENNDYNFSSEIRALSEFLNTSIELKGKYIELKIYFNIGMAYLSTKSKEDAEIYFNKIVNTNSHISKVTIAKDFLRPIGEKYESMEVNDFAIKWYKKAVEYYPKVGVIKKLRKM